MKRLLAAALLALSSITFAATTIPVQLISGAGSTAGQVVLSNGPVTAPGWGSVPPAALAAQAANTLLGNATASSAAPTAIAIPSCSTSNSAIRYTLATGFSCGTAFALTSGTLAQFATTTSAQLAGIVSDETGSGALVFGTNPVLSGASISGGGGINGVPIGGTTPAAGAFTALNSSSGSINATIGASTPGPAAFTTISASGLISPASSIGIQATSTNDSAATTSIGYGTTASAGPTAVTAGTTTNIVSMSLAPGNWLAQCTGETNPAGTTTTSAFIVGLSSTSGTLGALGTFSQLQVSAGAGFQQVLPTPVTEFRLATTTTVYCMVNINFAASTMQATAIMRVWRPR